MTPFPAIFLLIVAAASAATNPFENCTRSGLNEECVGYYTNVNQLPSEKYLFELITSNYNADLRPRRNSSRPVRVQLKLQLESIQNFDEKNNLLQIGARIKLQWHDNFIAWRRKKADEANCYCFMSVPASKIWFPPIAVVNSPDYGRALLDASRYKAWVYDTGLVYLETSGVLSVKCNVDIEQYPFDFQTCSILITSPYYEESQLKLKFAHKKHWQMEDSMAVGNAFELSKAWRRHPLWKYVGEKHRYPKSNFLRFEITLERRPLYYNVNIIAPSVILTICVLIIYVLSVDEAAKFGAGFAILLAYTIFNNMVVGDIPRSSGAIPRISIYIICQRIYIAVLIIGGQGLVFLCLTKAKRSEKRPSMAPPRFAFRAAEVLGKVLLVRHIKKYKTAKCNETDEKKREGSPDDLCAYDQWYQIALVVNRITLILYVCAIIITPIVITQTSPRYAQTVRDKAMTSRINDASDYSLDDSTREIERQIDTNDFDYDVDDVDDDDDYEYDNEAEDDYDDDDYNYDDYYDDDDE